MTPRTKLLIVLAVIAVILGGMRLALPQIVRSYVNAEMAELGEYTGRVGEIDIALLRGAYTLRNLVIDKRGAETGAHFVDLEAADISLQWDALISGELVGEIVADGLVLNLIQARTEKDTQLGTGVNWTEKVKELFPFQFNRVEAGKALVTFRAPGIDTDEVLTLSDAHLILENLTNVRREDRDAFADLNFRGNVMSSAALELTGQIDPNEQVPTFDVNLELRDTELTDVNPWLDRFLKIDAEQGRFSMYMELAAADGRFEGYVKPILKDAKIFGIEEADENPLRKAWEAIVDVAGEIFENQATDQIATQIPLSGKLENPDAGTLVAIVNLLRNAFVAAFSHSLEGTINLRDVDLDADVDPA
jgi:hypothetical protein